MYDMSRGLCCVCLALLSGIIGPTTVQGRTHFAQNIAFAKLPKCSSVLTYYSYSGSMGGDGWSTMTSRINGGTFNFFEASAFTHIGLRYNYMGCSVYGNFYNIVNGYIWDTGFLTINSLGTGCMNTFLWIYISLQVPPKEGTFNYYDFVPTCYFTGPACTYKGPYVTTITNKDARSFALTCTYRLITLGQPVACYSDIATVQDITSLSLLPSFTLSAMSLPSKSTSYPAYVMGFEGTYSVNGMGILTDTSTSTTGAGSFDGALYLDKTLQGDMVIVEGWVTTVCPNAATTGTSCSTADLMGSFYLRAWELGIIGNETIRKTSPPLAKLPWTRTWNCKSSGDIEYHFPVENCNDSSAPSVHWVGLWSQYSNDDEEYHNSECFAVGYDGVRTNSLIMVPNGYDAEIHATVTFVSDDEYPTIEYVLFGAECGSPHGTCYGPGMMKGCERAVSHNANTPYVDLGVSVLDQTVWLSDKSGFLDASAYEGVKDVTTTMSMWVPGEDVIQTSIDFQLYFYTHSRALAAVHWLDGYYPISQAGDVVFEGLSALGTGDYQKSLLPAKLPETTVKSIPPAQRFPIICYFKNIPKNCVISAKPFCATGFIPDEKDPTTVEIVPVEVSFQADMLIKLGGLDSIPGTASYRAHMQLTSPDGTPFGSPTDVTGLLIPIHTDGSAADTALPGGCTVWELIMLIVTIALPAILDSLARWAHAPGWVRAIFDLGTVILLLLFDIMLIWANPAHIIQILTVVEYLEIHHPALGAYNWVEPWLPTQHLLGPINVDVEVVRAAAQRVIDAINAVADADAERTGDLELEEDPNPFLGGMTCSPEISLTAGPASSAFIQPGIWRINCEDTSSASTAEAKFLTIQGVERSIVEMLKDLNIAHVSFYGFGTLDSSTVTPPAVVGLLCTVPVKLQYNKGDTTPVRIAITGKCRLSVNGYIVTSDAKYTMHSIGVTTVDFPKRSN